MKKSRSQNQRYGWDPVSLIPWDIFSSLFTFYIMIEMGLIAFLDETHELINAIMYWLDVCSICVFVIGILVEFRRGYYYKGELILDRERIILNYSVWRIVLDSLVVILIGLTLFPKVRYNPLRIIVWWRFYFLIKLDDTIFRGLHSRFGWFVVYTFFKLLIIFYLFCHYMGCLYYWIDFTLIKNGYGGPGAYLEMAVYYEYLWSPVLAEVWYLQYMYTMYYSIETFTTVAYGDNTPKNPYQVMFVTAFLILSAVGLSYILQEIVILLYQFSKNRILYLRKLFSIKRYLILKDINQDLQEKLINYYEYLWFEERLLKESELSQIMKKLPTALRGKLINQIFFNYFSSIDFLVLLNPNLCDKVANLAQQRMALSQQIIFEPYDRSSNSLFLTKPKQAQYYFKYSKDSDTTINLNNKFLTAFGEYQFFTSIAGPCGMQVLHQNVVYQIPRPEFIALIKNSDINVYNKFIFRKENILTSNINIFGMCDVCQTQSHNIIKCPKMHYCVSRIGLIWQQKNLVNDRTKKNRRESRNSRTGLSLSRNRLRATNYKIREYLVQLQNLVNLAGNSVGCYHDLERVYLLRHSEQKFNLNFINLSY